MKFDPLKSSQKIVEDYRRYILTTFKTDNESINRQLETLVSPDEISNGPYLSIAKNYKHVCPMSELIPEKLSKGFLRLKGKLDPRKIDLYQHQVTTIEKVTSQDHNLVLSTGTGSGKTLSFLIPILNHLLQEEEENKLTPGVRAMLIYPMNALANDQLDNLRGYLKGTKITFGSYTGETKKTYDQEAVNKYKEKYGFEPTNELLFREQMIESPPNILITNYSMLEHLLIKPNNKTLFGEPGNNHWKFIVLDEAHMYTGARGSEVSILLRRLNETLDNEKVRYILTSATLGDENDDSQVISFANQLCGTKDNPFLEEDVVRATHFETERPESMALVENSFYQELDELIDESDMPDFLEDDINEYLDSFPCEGSSYEERIFDIVSKDPRVYILRDYLESGPKSIQDIIEKMDEDSDFIMSFIKIASMAKKDEYKLFDSRYHMFIRSIDGVYTTLTEEPTVFIHPTLEHFNEETNQKEKVFEISTCYNCNCLYLVQRS